MSRVLRITQRYLRCADRMSVVAGSDRGRAVALIIAALLDEATLPGPQDTRALVPPTGAAFVRRVPGRNLWLWFKVTESEVVLIALTADPPVPAT